MKMAAIERHAPHISTLSLCAACKIGGVISANPVLCTSLTKTMLNRLALLPLTNKIE